MPSPQHNNAWLDELNAEQRDVVTQGQGPLLVVAGAGSGKTKTLAYRVAYLISTGISPERILLLTFTRRAAEEMLRRAATVMDTDTSAPGQVWGGTFHSTANRLLRIYGDAVNLSPDFTVMDQSDAEDLMNVLRQELDLSNKESRFPRKGTCLAIYSRCVNSGKNLSTVLKEHFPWCDEWKEELQSLFSTYVTRKQEKAVLDYDDLLLYWASVLDNEDVAKRVGGRFDYILVDEYQDTNPLQARILEGMCQHNHNLMVVGDDAQSIYGFRAATVQNMIEFHQRFPDTVVRKLQLNYRSVSPILEVTNRVMDHARELYDKELYANRGSGQRPSLVVCPTESKQDEFIAASVCQHYEEGIPLHRQAVLFRASHLSASLEIELTRRNIPYRKYGGLRFLEAAHVKDLVAFLRIQENPQDEMAWLRVLQLLDGVGPVTAMKIAQQVMAPGKNPSDVASFPAPKSAEHKLSEMAQMFEDVATIPTTEPEAHVDRIRTFYEPFIQDKYENPMRRKQDLDHLQQLATGFKTRRQFLADLVLNPPSSMSDLATDTDEEEDYLVLSTIHSAKGCEWDTVFLMHASEGCLPSDMTAGDEDEIEEERRLAYVAMTRARDFLYVSWPLRYYTRKGRNSDRHSYAPVSRFLQPPEVQDAFDRFSWDGGFGDMDDVEEFSFPDITKDVQDWQSRMWD